MHTIPRDTCLPQINPSEGGTLDITTMYLNLYDFSQCPLIPLAFSLLDKASGWTTPSWIQCYSLLLSYYDFNMILWELFLEVFLHEVFVCLCMSLWSWINCIKIFRRFAVISCSTSRIFARNTVDCHPWLAKMQWVQSWGRQEAPSCNFPRR